MSSQIPGMSSQNLFGNEHDLYCLKNKTNHDVISLEICMTCIVLKKQTGRILKFGKKYTEMLQFIRLVADSGI